MVGIGPAPSPGINGAASACPGGNSFSLLGELGGSPDPNGYWTDPNGNAHGATFDPLLDIAGIYTYTVGNACQNASATVNVSFAAAPNPGTNGNLTLCSNGAATNLITGLGGAPSAGGSWTSPGGVPFGNSYDPVVNLPGIYTYTVAATQEMRARFAARLPHETIGMPYSTRKHTLRLEPCACIAATARIDGELIRVRYPAGMNYADEPV